LFFNILRFIFDFIFLAFLLHYIKHKIDKTTKIFRYIAMQLFNIKSVIKQVSAPYATEVCNSAADERVQLQQTLLDEYEIANLKKQIWRALSHRFNFNVLHAIAENAENHVKQAKKMLDKHEISLPA